MSKRTAVQVDGYTLSYLDGKPIDAEPTYSTIDEALRRAARRSRLDADHVVLVHEGALAGRVRGWAQAGKAWWVKKCAPCVGVGVVCGVLSDWKLPCSTCTGTGWCIDWSAAAARG